MKMSTFNLQKGETSTMYTLNETAAFIFNKLKTQTTEEEIVDKLHKRYGVSETKALQDVKNTLKKLLRLKIFQLR